MIVLMKLSKDFLLQICMERGTTSTEEHNLNKICLAFTYSFSPLILCPACSTTNTSAPELPRILRDPLLSSCPACSFLVLPCLLLYRWKSGCFPSLLSFQNFTNDFWPQCNCKYMGIVSRKAVGTH